MIMKFKGQSILKLNILCFGINMEPVFDFSRKGQEEFYNSMKKKRKEISELIKDSKEREKLYGIIDDTIEIYEKEKISQLNVVLELVRDYGYSPVEARKFINTVKKIKLDKLKYNPSFLEN